MPIHRLVVLFVLLTACAGGDDTPPPDADLRPVPIEPAGQFAAQSSLSLTAPPAAIDTVLADLNAATDGPDDPSRYLIDLVIDRLPDGRIKSVATGLGPYVAAYVNARLATAAPRFVPGIRALVDGLSGIARRLTTIERLEIDRDGRVLRTIEGLRYGDAAVHFADVGESDVTAVARAIVASDGLVITAHTVDIAYGTHLRLGLDRAVIPGVAPGARDLAQALTALVDCPQLGTLIAEALGLGPAGLYASACSIGLTNVATRIYDRMPAGSITLDVAGTARAIDRDGNGTLDAFAGGRWAGTFDGVAIGVSTFSGTGEPVNR